MADTKKTAPEKPAKTDLTDSERAKIPGWHERWTNIALRTARQTNADREKIVESINALYEMSNLKKPKMIIFSPSPLAAQITAGFLGALSAIGKHDSLGSGEKSLKDFVADPNVPSYIHTKGVTKDIAAFLGMKDQKGKPEDGIRNSVISAVVAGLQILRGEQDMEKRTRSRSSMESKIQQTIKDTVTNKPNQAIFTVTGATCFELLHRNITNQAYENMWNGSSDQMHRMSSPSTDATRREIESMLKEISASWAKGLANQLDERYSQLMVDTMATAQNMYTGGNMWASGANFISFYRHNCPRLPIDWSRWDHYEAVAMLSGFRYVHEDFCIITDFPEIFKLDDQLRPHGETGPSHKWRDGFQLFHWHGTRIPGEWVTNKKSLTPAMALGQNNLELRRSACEILGWDNILNELNAKTLDKDPDPQMGELVTVTIPARSGMAAVNAKFLRVECGTKRKFAIGVPPQCNTVRQAQAWLAGYDEGNYTPPEVRA